MNKREQTDVEKLLTIANYAEIEIKYFKSLEVDEKYLQIIDKLEYIENIAKGKIDRYGDEI